MNARNEQLMQHSIKAYTRAGLFVYDRLVMDVLARYVWGCAADNFISYYRNHMTANHAEIGVGTGYCVDRSGLELANPRLALIDLQKNCLDVAGKRLSRFKPETYLHDVLRPFEIDIECFDSIALGGVLHCLPGDMREKGRVFDALSPITKAGTTIFGYTLVADGVTKNKRRRVTHHCLNQLRVINNRNDCFADLCREIEGRFDDSKLELIGSMAFFSAVVPASNRTFITNCNEDEHHD